LAELQRRLHRISRWFHKNWRCHYYYIEYCGLFYL
jgi:hypothetical protein